MTVLDPVFNDLSARPPAPDPAVARELMSGVVAVLRDAPANRLGTGLRVPEDFYDIELAPAYAIRIWLNDRHVPREEMSFLLRLATRSPFLASTPTDLVDHALTLDVLHQGQHSDALVAALLLDVPLVSLRQVPWDRSMVQVRSEELVDDEIAVQNIDLPNLSLLQHYIELSNWIDTRRRRSVADMHMLWDTRSQIFPSLIFCPNTRAQLDSIQPGDPRFQRVLKLLFDLDIYFFGWSEGAFDRSAFPRCNPVSPKTLEDCENDYRFATEDGRVVVAHWHLYFTPGAGRLYFEADGANRKGVICHVGGKLPDATYGRT